MQENPGWIQPLKSGNATIDKIFMSLSTWLNNPTFPGGLTVGNGTPATYSSSTGAQTSPMPASAVLGSGGGFATLDGHAIVTSFSATSSIIQAGSFSGTTAVGGGLTITFPTAFPTNCVFAVAIPNNGAYYGALTQAVAAPNFTAIFATAAGVAYGSHAVAGVWFAVGN